MATFTKLADGTWGIKSSDRKLDIGDVAVVRRRDGSSKTVTVDAVVTEGRNGGIYRVCTAPVPHEYALANLQQQSRATAARVTRERGVYIDWEEPAHLAAEREWWSTHPNGTQQQYDAMLAGDRE